MNSMRSWKTPTAEQVEKAVALLARPERYRYFFDRLDNPEWLKPLKKRGFFSSPPDPVHNEKEGTVSFPPWPESRYLARMAKLGVVADQVCEYALEIPDTQNVVVRSDLLDIALSLPPQKSLLFVPKVSGWIDSPHHFLLPDKLGALSVHLATAGETESAIGLARKVLALSPPDQPTSTPRPQSSIEVWSYGEILRRYMPGIVEAAGTPALTMLCDLLENAVDMSQRQGRRFAPEDLSYIWNPTMEGGDTRSGIRSGLVVAVRDAAEHLARKTPSEVPRIVEALEARPWKIFRRLGLHVLRKFATDVPNLVLDRLTDETLSDDWAFRHEYRLLARDCFKNLEPSKQKDVLDWIETGPDPSEFLAEREKRTGAPPTNADAKSFKERKRRDRLEPILQDLPEAWRQRYDALVAEFGEPEFPAARPQIFRGPTSPKTVDELSAMSVDALAAFLRDWIPSRDWHSPTPEGLGRCLSDVVAQDATKFAGSALAFADVDPTYVRSILTGMRDAAKNGQELEWPPILALCASVLEKPIEIPGRDPKDFDLDPDWSWTRKSIADLIYQGLGDSANSFPFGLRDTVWTILESLTHDYDPTNDLDQPADPGRLDALTLSINTTSGSAMHAVVRYALWVRRHLDEATQEQGLQAMPETRAVLDEHLGADTHPTIVMMAVYGQWFPWLVLIDRNWAIASVRRIFPFEESAQESWLAAWTSYVSYNAPYDNVFAIISSTYRLAIDRLATTPDASEVTTHSHERLAEHLMVFFWRGRLESAEEGALIERFFSEAPEALRAHAIGFVGRSLEAEKAHVPPEVMARLETLLESRVAAAQNDPGRFRVELAAFGWWLASGKLKAQWAIDQLLRILELTGDVEVAHDVVAELARIAENDPLKTVRALSLIINTTHDLLMPIGWESSVRTVLAAAISSGNPKASDSAIGLIHDFGARGVHAYRDMLPGPQSEG